MAPLGRQGPTLIADLVKQALVGKSGQNVPNLVDPIARNPSDGTSLGSRSAAKRERLQHGVLDGWKHREWDRRLRLRGRPQPAGSPIGVGEQVTFEIIEQ